MTTPRDLADRPMQSPGKTPPSPAKKRTPPTRPRSQICRREGCDRPVSAIDRGYCTGLCRLIDREQDRSRRICQAIGPGAETAELWSTIASLGDAWAEYLQLEDRLGQAASSVGITEEQWRAIKIGDGLLTTHPV